MFRAICHTRNGELFATIHNDLLTAYRECVPAGKLTWHIMMFLAVRDSISADGVPVLISYNDDTAWWIQEIQPPVKSIPALTMPDAHHH